MSNSFDKTVTVLTDEKEYHNWRLQIAMHAASGLLASQDKTGWQLAVLAQVSLRAADALLDAASRALPMPTTAPQQEPPKVEILPEPEDGPELEDV
jgi:hypothetical protein